MKIVPLYSCLHFNNYQYTWQSLLFNLFCKAKKMSSDLPENLQIKRESSPPSTPEDRTPHDIKAKLNLHVKRRLQDFNQTGQENAILNTKSQGVFTDAKQEPQKIETIRQKRPYHKRADKNKSSTQFSDNTLISSTGSETITTPQRRYKHKVKQIVANDNQDSSATNSIEDNTSVHHIATIAAGAISAGDEDDGGHDSELKAGREKEKCPDVLAMVLSMKKRALMQNPEIQSFLIEILEAIKR